MVALAEPRQPMKDGREYLRHDFIIDILGVTALQKARKGLDNILDAKMHLLTFF